MVQERGRVHGRSTEASNLSQDRQGVAREGLVPPPHGKQPVHRYQWGRESGGVARPSCRRRAAEAGRPRAAADRRAPRTHSPHTRTALRDIHWQRPSSRTADGKESTVRKLDDRRSHTLAQTGRYFVLFFFFLISFTGRGI